MNASYVARLQGRRLSTLPLNWKKQSQEGTLIAVASGEEVVSIPSLIELKFKASFSAVLSGNCH